MIDLLKRPETFRKVEAGLVTSVYMILVFSMATAGLDDTPKTLFDEARLPFGYYENYVFPNLIRYTVLFGAFLLLHYRLVPPLFQKEEIFSHAFFIFLTFLGTGLLLGVADTYTRYYLYGTYNTEEVVYSIVFRDSLIDAFVLVLLVGIYSVLRHVGQLVLNDSESIQPRYRIITKDSLVALAVWFISLVLLVIAEMEAELVLGWGIVIPSALALYLFAFLRLIPASLNAKRPFLYYMLRIVLTLVAAVIPLLLILTALTNDPEISLGIVFFNAVCQFLITAPLAWILFKRYARDNEELFTLKKELGQTYASVDFLRSQINPHFLFNALNTIYGTAIQEKAERTSEGIEKLGDMMRFMLQENMQEKIPLVRETEYLTNYISLQKLRTDPIPTIQVQVEIQQPVHPVQIAPMLLIPFVENAFKHGISFREPSHIMISLEVKEHVLHFDVHNSKHDRQGNDPEKNNNGIGLPNVRQRLQLLYPGRHELMIRETAREFFVHLTIRLQ
jgi:two-component system, LytTR family, sensor kinase